MCLAIPMKIESIEGQVGRASIPGGQYAARLDFLDNVKVGDYVLVHAGFAISLVEEEDAKKTWELIEPYVSQANPYKKAD